MLTFNDDPASDALGSRCAELMRACIHDAWSDWTKSPHASELHVTSFRAQFMNHQVIHHALKRTALLKDIKVDKIGGNMGFVVDGRIFVRPKYARSSHRSSNYPTKAAIAFHDQSIDLFGGIARLELIYTLNKLKTSVQDICLTQRQNDQIQWIVPLLDPSLPAQAKLTELPREEPVETTAKRIIKSKKTYGTDQGDRDKRGGAAV